MSDESQEPEMVHWFTLTDANGESYDIHSHLSEKEGENDIFFIGRGPFLKLDNKHVSRHQVKLLLNFDTGAASLVSLGTNPSTIVRATSGVDDVICERNLPYALHSGDSVCLWRTECRYTFYVSQTKAPVPVFEDLPEPPPEDDCSPDASEKKVAPPPPSSLPPSGSTTPQRRIVPPSSNASPLRASAVDAVTQPSSPMLGSRPGTPLGVRSRADTVLDDTLSPGVLQNKPSGELQNKVFSAWTRRLKETTIPADRRSMVARLLAVNELSDDLLLDESKPDPIVLDHDTLQSVGIAVAADRLQIMGLLESRRKRALARASSSSSGNLLSMQRAKSSKDVISLAVEEATPDGWAESGAHGALLRRLEEQAHKIGVLETSLAQSLSMCESLQRKLARAQGQSGSSLSGHDRSSSTTDRSRRPSGFKLPDVLVSPRGRRSGDKDDDTDSSENTSGRRTHRSRRESVRGEGSVMARRRDSKVSSRSISHKSKDDGSKDAKDSPKGSPKGSPKTPEGEDTDTDDDAMEKRKHVIAEILNTERDYVRDLKWIVEQYVEPCKSRNLLNQAEQQQLFSNIQSLYHLHEEILKMIQAETQGETGGGMLSIGQTFVKIGSYLKVYATYVVDQDGMRDFLLAKREAVPAFSDLCLEVKRMPESRGLDLESFLIKPVQRVCKYPLLIDQLLRATPPEETKDRELLAQALESVRAVANHVNETKRSVTMIARVAELSREMTGLPPNFELAVATRRFLHEGELTRLNFLQGPGSPAMGRKQQKKMMADNVVHVFLFNDTLIETKATKGKYTVREVVSFTSQTYGEQVPHEMEPNAFQIIIRGPNAERATYFYGAKTPEEAEIWTAQLQKVLKVTMLTRRSSTLRLDRKMSNSPIPVRKNTSLRRPGP